VLLRLAYLGLTNTFALLRLLPTTDRNKDIEILVLRHQIAVLQRQGVSRRTPTPATTSDLAQAPTAGTPGHYPAPAPRPTPPTPRPGIRPKRPGRPRTIRSTRVLVLRLAKENQNWGYRRIHGELLVLGIKIAASTVWQILSDAHIDPAPHRASSTWAQFLRSQAEVLLACDFFETATITGTRMYVLVGIEHAQRRIRILGATAHPTAVWVPQAARNLIMDLEDASYRARFLIRDRDGKFPHLFDTILADASIEVVLSGVQMPKMNSIVERWIQTCRHELLDRTLIWNQRHLLHALREYERFYNTHRPHQGIANARPLQPLPEPITNPAQISQLDIRQSPRLGGILNEYHHAA
jgi:putative transposase